MGNGPKRGITTRYTSVYPHACGERLRIFVFFLFLRGLSPRLWGTERLAVVETIKPRFIPTPVGNGNVFTSTLIQSSGLSPRLWGTAKKPLQEQGQCRFIPTPVGNGPATCQSVSLPSVYPHACGERGTGRWRDQLAHGLSPRLWGTGAPCINLAGNGRFIPTPVGNGLNIYNCF